MQQYQGDPRGLSPITLAFIGDGVFELMVRQHLVAEKGAMPANKLHRLTVQQVSASAQAPLYDRLLPELTQQEQDILRRGRNASSGHVPKSCTVEEYRKATAIEALFGYLYLGGEHRRLDELFGQVMRESQTPEA